LLRLIGPTVLRGAMNDRQARYCDDQQLHRTEKISIDQ
jgi:hypothetical protein